MPELTEGKEACFFVGNLKQLHLSLLVLSFPGHEISFLNFFDCQVNSRCLINTRESTFNRGLQKAKDQVFLLIAHMPSHPELSSVYPSRLFYAHTKIEELGRESSVGEREFPHPQKWYRTQHTVLQFAFFTP